MHTQNKSTAAGHTAGPYYLVHTDGDMGLIAEIGTRRNVALTYEKRDGHLLAAAPDLLTTCYVLLHGVETAASYFDSNKRTLAKGGGYNLRTIELMITGFRADAALARAAIARAKGVQS